MPRTPKRSLELESLERKFGDLLESVPDAMVVASQRGEIALVNTQTETMFGHSREELVGQPVEILLPERLRRPINLAMVNSINEIGHVMGKKTIAECVENEATLDRLREVGVDYGQGFYLGRPELV